MDTKSIKLKIDKVNIRIDRLQSRLKYLENKKARLENECIIKVAPQVNITLAELDEFLKARRERKADKWIEQKISQ